MKKVRFGSGNRTKACKCAECSVDIGPGTIRWFDNTIFPRKPICDDCKELKDKGLPDAGYPATETQELITWLECNLPRLIAKGICLAEDNQLVYVKAELPGLILNDEDLPDEDADSLESGIDSDDFLS